MKWKALATVKVIHSWAVSCGSLVPEAWRSRRRRPCRPPRAADARDELQNEREVKQAKPHRAATWQDAGAYAAIVDSA